MRHKALGSLHILAVCLLATGCSGTGKSESVEPASVESPAAYVAGTESRIVTSSTTKREYQISVAVPRGYEESGREYPVLYAVDANGMFGTVVETARLLFLGGHIPELIVVGIGYPVGYYLDAIPPRSLDLSPTTDRAWEQNVVSVLPEGIVPEGTGGAPEFLQFIRTDLIPLIERQYRVMRDDRAFLGHSAGGLFAVYALLQGGNLFQRMVCASPALWYDEAVIFDMEREYAEAHDSLPVRMFLSVGSEDDDELRPQGWGRYISNVRQLRDVLNQRGYEGLEMETAFFENEDHFSVVPISISTGLRYIYAR